MSPASYHLANVTHWPSGLMGVSKPHKAIVYASGDLVLDLAETPDSYRVKAICLNCRWEGQMRLRKGSLVTANTGVECPKCGCGTVTGGTLIASETPETDSSKDVEHRQADAEEMYVMELEAWELRQETKEGKRR